MALDINTERDQEEAYRSQLRPRGGPVLRGLRILVPRFFAPFIATTATHGWWVRLFDGNDNLLAYVGPFVGIAAIQEVIFWIFWIARRLGAVSYDHRQE